MFGGGEVLGIKRYTFTTQEETLEMLKKLSKETRIPVSRHLEEAIQDLFKKYGKEVSKDK
jgi:cytosine/adenosine deaminase-related metal-dependent hydrolase